MTTTSTQSSFTKQYHDELQRRKASRPNPLVAQTLETVLGDTGLLDVQDSLAVTAAKNITQTIIDYANDSRLVDGIKRAARDVHYGLTIGYFPNGDPHEPESILCTDVDREGNVTDYNWVNYEDYEVRDGVTPEDIPLVLDRYALENACNAANESSLFRFLKLTLSVCDGLYISGTTSS